MRAVRDSGQPGKTRSSVTDSAVTVARHLRLCVALVAVLLVVPPLVSALDDGNGPVCSSIRLNRSVAAPAANLKLTPLSHAVTAQSVAVDGGSGILSRAAALDD